MKEITIDPNTLMLSTKVLADPATLSMVEQKNIKLKLGIFDSDPNNSEKPVLVLLHGHSSSHRVFDGQIEQYREKYRVIAMDLLGHGQSTKFSELNLSSDERETLGKTFYSFSAMVAEVAQVLKQENIKAAHFIGWSLGGNIAYGIAAEAPELVASIVSIASPPVKISADGLSNGFSPWFVTNIIPQWVEHPAPTNPEEAAGLRGFMGFDETDGFFVEDMMGTDPDVRKYLFLNLAEYNSPTYDRTERDGDHFVRSTTIPLCLLVGDKDMGINYGLIASFSTALQNAHSQVHVIPGAPHAVFRTHPLEYYKIVVEFFNTVSPTTKVAPPATPSTTLLSDAQRITTFGRSAPSSDDTDAIQKLPGTGVSYSEA